jgi:predicted site-specific integrase-resolvase
LTARQCTLLVMNEGEQHLDLVQDFVDVVTWMCSRIYGIRGAKNRAQRAVAAAQEAPCD